MKITRYDLTDFTDLGTIVFYPIRTFHAEIQGNLAQDKEVILKKASSNNYLYSTDLNSEYIDFAKYDFRFNLPDTKYWSSLDLNLYSYQDLTSKFGVDPESISKNLVPQLITRTQDRKHYFGKLANSENTIYLVNIPPEFIWKVEVYNSKLTTNNSESNSFIDYEVLKVLDPGSISEKPIMSICFGPSWNTQLQDYTFSEVKNVSEYIKRYTDPDISDNIPCLTKEIYSSFTEYISKAKYTELVKEEIESEKLLYLVTSTQGEVNTIDVFSAAFLESTSKFRNLNKNVLRNDETLDYSVISKKGNLVFDTRSNILLGLGGDINDCPLLKNKLDLLPDNAYSKSSDSGKIKEIYTHPKNQEILGENPELSPYWFRESEIKDSIFNYFVISKKGNGVLEPYGLTYLRNNKTLEIKITQDYGNEFSGIQDLTEADWTETTDSNGNIIITPKDQTPGKLFKILFTEVEFRFLLKFSLGGSTYGYEMSKFQSLGINLFYYDYTENTEIKYSGESIKFTESRPLLFRATTETNSNYYIPGDSKYIINLSSSSGGTSEKLNLNLDGKYTKISVSDLKNLGISGKEVSVIGELRKKQYQVLIETHGEIQVSTSKVLTYEFEDTVEISFYSETEINFKIENLDTGKEDSWSRSEDSNIITLTLNKIKSNYKIIASV